MAAMRPYACCSLQFLLSVCCLSLRAFASQVRELTSNDISNIGKITNKDFIAVFFDKPEIRKSHPKFAREFSKSSKVLESFGFELAKVNCPEQSQSLSECAKDKVLVYRNGESSLLEAVDISYLFDVHSIVANFLHISLSEQFHYVSDEQSLKELLVEGRGKKNVLFCFVKGLGMKEHRHFLELVHYSKSDTLFAMTTDDSIAKEYGLSSGVEAAMFLFHCKDVSSSKDECSSTQYKGKIDRIPLLRFLQSQTLPKYVVLPGNRTTVYDSLSPAINRVFIFSYKITDFETKELEQMVMDFQGYIGVILVDVNEHKSMLSSFGLSEETNFPTAAFVPFKSKSNDLTYTELYPENIAVFTINNLKNFIKPLVENPVSEYKRIAEDSSLQKRDYVEYTDAMKNSDTNYLLSLGSLLVVFCPEDHEQCKEFSKTLRRVVRTFDRAGEEGLTIAYVKTSLHKKRFEGQTFPVIHFHLDNPSEFIQYTDELEYEPLMDFITVSASMKMPVLLPPSLSDEVPILFTEDNDDGDVSEQVSEYTESTGETTDEESLSPEETEDDEISAAVLKAKLSVLPSDLVPALTDKTFDVVRKENDLLVVDFFQPWDARCKAFSQPYVDAAASLGSLDVGNFAIKLARVNCFDWTDVCQKNNITIYPTIKMFRKGSDDIIYNGPLDSDHLTKAVLLLQSPVPLALKSKDEVQMFFDGKLPKLPMKVTDIAVVGMFSDEKGKEFRAFEAASQSLYSKFLLGYVAGETAASLSADYGLRLPSLLAFKRNDPYQPMSVFSDPFTSENIADFVHRSNIPSFGELTPFNLPTYLMHKRPLLIVFRADSEDASITPIMRNMARDNALPSVFLCWMPVYSSKDVNAEILKTYTGSSDTLPALVLVNHDKGTFYHYKGEVAKPAVLSWVEDILHGKEWVSESLKREEWKPLQEGYDFLKFIDEEEEEKERKRLKREKLEKAVEDEITNEEDEEQEDEDTWEELNHHEYKPTKHDEKPKTGRLRRPEVKHNVRDEL